MSCLSYWYQTADNGSEVQTRHIPWQKAGELEYGPRGGRDVLIIASDLPLSNPEAVARTPNKLTEEDKRKLKAQGVSSNCKDELAIANARCKLDKHCEIVGVLSGQLPQEEVTKSISHLLSSTQNDGGKIPLKVVLLTTPNV